MNRIRGFEEADIMLKHFLNNSSLSQPQWSLHPLRFPRSRGTETPKGKEYKQPLMIANETLIGTLMKTEILTNNYTIIIRRTVRR